MSEPNDHLRRARERITSPHATGAPLSRQELAELVNAWVYHNTDPHRVIEMDGEPRPVTKDFRPERLNFKVEAGVVIAVTKG